MTTLSLAKAQCRVTSTSEDTIIQQYLDAAVEFVEDYTKTKLSRITVTETFEAFPASYFALGYGPNPGTVVITYMSGEEVTIEDALVVDGKVYPVSEWPTCDAHTPVTVSYEAGFAAGSIPKKLTLAVLLLVGEYFDKRSASEASPATVQAVHSLCEKHRLPVIA